VSQLPSGKEYTAFTLFLLMILAIVPVYAAGFYLSHPPTNQQRTTIGGLQLESTSVGMTGLSQYGPSLNLDAVVYNPNGFGARLDSANYSVYANGRYVGSGLTAHEYDFAPQSTLILTFPVSIGWKTAFHTLGSYILSLGSVTWEVKGTANIEVNGFPLSVSFELAIY
jgi:LEA14-like dessication related protein